jgi:uncharacterized membrane protein
MDAEIARLLKSKDPDDRKKGISLLGQNPNKNDLPILMKLYKNDPNEGVRLVAQRTGRYVKQAINQVSYYEMKEIEKPQVISVSKQNQERSKTLLDRAMVLAVANNHDDLEKAREMGIMAYKLNPNIVSDTYYSGMLTQIFGIGKENLEDYLESRQAKEQRPSVGCAVALTDLFMYILVVAICFIVTLGFFYLFALEPLQSLLDRIAQLSSTQPVETIFSQEITINATLLAGVIAAGLGVGLFIAMSTASYNNNLNFIARRLLRGKGSWSNLTHDMIGLNVGMYILINIVMVAFLYQFTNLMVAVDLSDRNRIFDNTLARVQGNNTLTILLACLGVVGMANLLFMSRIIGRSYNFGWFRGCATIILSFLLLIAIVGVTVMLINYSFNAMLLPATL